MRREGEAWAYGFVVEDRHLNRGGITHGGMIATFLDIVMGRTAHDSIRPRSCATIQLNLHYVSASNPGEFVEARAETVKTTSTLVFSRATCTAEGRVVAMADGVWKILAPRAATRCRQPGEQIRKDSRYGPSGYRFPRRAQPIGRAYRGAFNDTHGATLGGHVVAEAIKRAKIDPAEVEDVLMGCGRPEGAGGGNIARQSAIRAGLPVTVAGVTVNRFCSSGLQTIAMAAQRIKSDEADVLVAGGARLDFALPE